VFCGFAVSVCIFSPPLLSRHVAADLRIFERDGQWPVAGLFLLPKGREPSMDSLRIAGLITVSLLTACLWIF
jgi:hypothetical protein